ncbi:Putative ribosomal protein L37 [Septoria linicola]|uniref:Large ribosomal subunit protein mL54 n=1 Tax=Septoria linicola TaxID=215465 RepID=A0A9Q9EFE3_9PEZI|nr:putative ribosomal protein L37 [Septoria linicola]USW47133.1 Putative ribosomal protein L37 [Septoria linicola]
MIGRQCMRRLAVRDALPLPATRRAFSNSTSVRAQAVSAHETTASVGRPNDKPAATSTSAAQPFSTPRSPSPTSPKLDLPIDTKQSKQATRIVSSVPAGTVLKGLNFMKNQQDPVALEDHEYPAWLWTALHDKGDTPGGQAKDAEGDLFSKSKKQRRIAAKALRKQQLLNPDSLAPKIPLYEQTIDLPGGDGTLQGNKQAYRAQDDLTKAMREKRRSKIKEDNFLREMS